MSRAADWTFRIERTSYKSADLIYEEPGRQRASISRPSSPP